MATPSDRNTRQYQDAQDAWGLEVRPRNLEDLSKLLAAIVVSCYALGLLTVNSYLYSLGVSDFALFRARFVLVGAAALSPILVALLILAAARLLVVALDTEDPISLKLMIIVAATIVGGGTLWVLFAIEQWLTPDDGFIHSGNVFPITLQLVIFGFGVAACGIVLVHISGYAEHHRERQEDDDLADQPLVGDVVLPPDATRARLLTLTKKLGDIREEHRQSTVKLRSLKARIRSTRSAMTAILAIVGLFMLMIYLLMFAFGAFPLLPEQFGGGQSRQAHLLFRDEAIDDAQIAKLGVTDSNPLSPLVNILWEAEDEYVVRPLGSAFEDTVIRIDKSNVSMVIMELSESDGSASGPATPVPSLAPLSTPMVGPE